MQQVSPLTSSKKPIAEQALLLLTHTISQLAGRWLPPPVVPGGCLELRGAPSGEEVLPEDKEFWHDLFHWWCESEHSPEGLRAYRTRKDPDGAWTSDALWRHIEGTQRDGGGIIFLGDEEYPSLLAEISDPPLVLSVLGCRAHLRNLAVSVVGSRKASAHALGQSAALGKVLSQAGVCVVSGGAIGCDIAAHAGVLASGILPAAAVVVFAGGLECFYPGVNGAIFRALKERGALFLSERLWRMDVRKKDFHARNRIISGISGTTVVIQAAIRSGAMITARQALDQGREVVVLTHPPGDVRAAGNMELLNSGAAVMFESREWAAEYLENVVKTTGYPKNFARNHNPGCGIPTA